MKPKVVLTGAILALVVMVALLIGCSAATPASPPPTSVPAAGAATTSAPAVKATVPAASDKKVTLTLVFGAVVNSQERYEKMLQGFTAKYPNITIKYIPVPATSWGEYTQKVVTLMVGGEKIDVIWNAIEAVPLMAEKGVTRELDTFMKADPGIQEYITDVHPKMLQGLTWKGKQYLLPFAWNNVLMFYNKNVLKDAGLADPPQNWTWSEFLTYAQKITKDTNGDNNPDIWGFQSTYLSWNSAPWLISNGTFWINEDFSKPYYTDPKAIEAMKYAYDLVWKHKVAPSGDFKAAEMFAGGKLGMFAGSPTTRGQLSPTGIKTTDFDVNFWPTNTGQIVKGSIWGCDGYGVAAKSENPEMAWELVKWMMSKEVMTNVASGSVLQNAPARRSLATGPEFAAVNPSHYQYFYQALDNSRSVVNSPIFANLMEIHNRYLSKAWAKEMTVDDAMTNIQKDMEAEIAKNK